MKSRPTYELLDGDAIQHVEGCVQFERLATALTHEANLHGGTGGLGALHS